MLMEKLRSYALNLNYKKIILCAAIVIAMVAFYIVPFSADEVIYLNKDINPFNFIQNTNTYLRYGYDDNTNKFISLLGDTANTNYRITNLPYSAQGYFYPNNFFFQGAVFTYSANDTARKIVCQVDLGFDYYFDDFGFEIYIIVPDSYFSFSGSYLSNGDLVPLSITSELITTDTIGNLYHNTDYISTVYYNYCLANRFFTNVDGNSAFFTETQINNTLQVMVYKLSCNISGLDKTPIESLFFTYSYSRSVQSTIYPRIIPYFYYPDQTITAYIKSSQDQVYTQQLYNQQQIIAQQQEIINQLEEVTGEPSSENEEKLEDLREVASTIDDISENIDIIHEAEQLPTLPFDDPGSSLPVPEDGETDSYNGFFNTFFTQFPLIQQIITSGSVCLLLYVLLRRV